VTRTAAPVYLDQPPLKEQQGPEGVSSIDPRPGLAGRSAGMGSLKSLIDTAEKSRGLHLAQTELLAIVTGSLTQDQGS